MAVIVFRKTEPIEAALQFFETSKEKVCFVIDAIGCFSGTITEGDIRRYVLKHGVLPNCLGDVVNKDADRVIEDDLNDDVVNLFDLSRGAVPVVKQDGSVVGVYGREDYATTLNGAAVTAIAPTRVSFAGGGSDTDYWFKENFGCVVNLGIAKYARVRIARNYDGQVNIRSLNTDQKLSLANSELYEYQGEKLRLVVECVKASRFRSGLDIDIFCDFEPGTGLGGSSSLVVATLLALGRISNVNLVGPELIRLAYHVEREQANIAGGWQDQIAAVNGGLSVCNFTARGFRNYKLAMRQNVQDHLNSTLFISRVGDLRSSADIHKTQKSASSSETYNDKMRKIVELAEQCVDLLGQEKFSMLGEMMHRGWLLKRSLGDFVSNAVIDNRYEQLREFGADGGRLLGAGGSGFILVNVPLERQHQFISLCESNYVPYDRVRIDTLGARIL